MGRRAAFLNENTTLDEINFEAYIVDTTNGVVTVTLPVSEAVNGDLAVFTHVAGGNNLVLAPSTGLIDGQASVVVPTGRSFTLHRRPTDTAGTPSTYTWTTVEGKVAFGYVFHNTTVDITSGAGATLLVYDNNFKSINTTNTVASGSITVLASGVATITLSLDYRVLIGSITGGVSLTIKRGSTLIWTENLLFEVSLLSTTNRSRTFMIRETVTSGDVITAYANNTTGQTLRLTSPTLQVYVE